MLSDHTIVSVFEVGKYPAVVVGLHGASFHIKRDPFVADEIFW